MKLLLKILLGFVIVLLLVAGGMVAYISYELRPEVLTGRMETFLSHNLGTEVKIKRCQLSLHDQSLAIFGLKIKDQQNVDMLSMDTLDTEVDLWEFFNDRLLVKAFELKGARFIIYKETKTSDPNYLFIEKKITVISRNRTKEEVKKERKNKLKWDVRRFSLKNINLRWDIKSEVVRSSPEYRRLHPRRGYFDPHHLNITLSYDAKDIYYQGDSSAMKITNFTARDKVSGLQVTHMETFLEQKGEKFYAHDLHVQSNETTVDIPLITGVIPSKKKGRKFSLKADSVRIHAVLKNIARPFAPVLYKFSTPLEATTDVVGTDSTFLFRNIHAFTKDGHLSVRAYGGISFPKMGTVPGRLVKYKTTVYFRVLSMHARAGIKKKIIGHFARISPSLSTILVSAGDVRFRGHLYIPYKKEHIWGRVTTGIGSLNANVWFNDRKKTMKGSVYSNDVDLKKITGNENLGRIAFWATFDLNIGKHRPKNKLPIGVFCGRALDASYKEIHLKNIDFKIKSDGRNVEGTIDHEKKFADLSCNFSFQGTDIKNTLKIKPHFKIKMKNLWKATGIPKLWKKLFGKKTPEEKQEAKEEKEKKKALKIKKKAEKKALKEKEKAQKAKKKKTKAQTEENEGSDT